MTETDVIGHLIDIEHQAAELLLDTQTEADRRVTEAKAKADAMYKEQYESMIAELENKYKEEATAVENGHDTVMKKYCDSVDCTATDTVAFNALLDKLLFSN